MIKVYLASPYSSGIPIRYSKKYTEVILGERYYGAVDACAYLANEGHIVHSPIVHWHMVAKRHKLRSDHEFWQEQNRVMLEWCESVYVLMLKGWNESAGVRMEIALAEKLGKYIWYMRLNSPGHRQKNKVKKYKLIREPINE